MDGATPRTSPTSRVPRRPAWARRLRLASALLLAVALLAAPFAYPAPRADHAVSAAGGGSVAPGRTDADRIAADAAGAGEWCDASDGAPIPKRKKVRRAILRVRTLPAKHPALVLAGLVPADLAPLRGPRLERAIERAVPLRPASAAPCGLLPRPPPPAPDAR